jgi:hypothetical protein
MTTQSTGMTNMTTQSTGMTNMTTQSTGMTNIKLMNIKMSTTETVSDCCLTPIQQLLSYIMARTS